MDKDVGSVKVENVVEAVGRLDENLDGEELGLATMDEGLVVEEVGSVVVENVVEAVGRLDENLDGVGLILKKKWMKDW